MIQPFCKRKLLSVIKAVVDIRNADARIQTGNLIKRKQMSQGKGVGGEGNNTENKARCGYRQDLGADLPQGPLTTPRIRTWPRFRKRK